jgi:hypothetical protein
MYFIAVSLKSEKRKKNPGYRVRPYDLRDGLTGIG